MTRRRIIVLLLVGILSIGGGYYVYSRFTAPPATAVTRQVVAVQRGTLEATVSATGNVTMPHQAKLSFGISGGSSGKVDEVKVKMGDKVTEGQVLAKMDPTSLERSVTSAWASLRTAQINLTKAQQPYDEQDIANAEAAVRNAQVGIETAQRGLEVARNSTTYAQTVRDRQYELNYFESSYSDAVRQGNRSQDELARMYNNIVVAREKLAVAQQQAANAIDNAQNDLAKAQDTLRNAEQDLADKRAGGDSQDIALKRNSLISAQTSYQTALDNLNQATLTAPFAGVIASVGFKEGEQAAASANISLIDPGLVQVEAILDEIDVSKIRTGQAAIVTLDALPDLQLKATVTAVSPVATRQSGVVNYPLTLTLENSNPAIKEGMTALAAITITHKENVLLVPNRALRTANGQRVVTVQVGNQTEQPRVTIGLANDQYTEILEGLTDGDQVIIETTTTPRLNIPGISGGGMPSGGMPSGSFGR